jgi:hypothetical protein
MSSIKRALRFAGGAAIVLGLIGLWLWRRKHHPLAGEIVAGAGGALLLAGAAAPSLVLALRAGWLKFAGAVGWINSRILLTVLFFVVITPMALIRRLVGGSPLRWRRGEAASYWRGRDENADPKHHEHPY